MALRLLGDSYPRELARVLGIPVSGVQAAVKGLERDGLVASRLTGRTRLLRMNPRYFALSALQAYLLVLANADSELRAGISKLRRRPRRTGKPL